MMMKAQGGKTRAMARVLPRAPSSISRELSRTASEATAPYHVRTAGKRAQALRHKPRRRAKLAPDTPLFGVVEHYLREGGSPEPIAGTLQRLWLDDPTRSVSHETLYTAL